MPSFSNAPPADPRGKSLELVRTPSLKPFIAIITSDDLLGCHTHFYHGRTMPCNTPDCPACEDGLPYRWHAWVSAMTEANHQHVLFECTAQAAESFVKYRKAHGKLRGCCFKAVRANRSPNGRVIISTKPADLDKIAIPEPPNIIKCLSIIWNLALPTVDVVGQLKNMDHVTVSPQVLSDMKPFNGNGDFAKRAAGVYT